MDSREQPDLDDPQVHRELHCAAARYHAAVLYFHLRKCEEPFCEVCLPAGLQPDAEVSDEMLSFVASRISMVNNN